MKYGFIVTIFCVMGILNLLSIVICGVLYFYLYEEEKESTLIATQAAQNAAQQSQVNYEKYEVTFN